MRKLSLVIGIVVIASSIVGCSGGSVSEAGALDKAAEIEKQTKAAGGEEQKP